MEKKFVLLVPSVIKKHLPSGIEIMRPWKLYMRADKKLLWIIEVNYLIQPLEENIKYCVPTVLDYAHKVKDELAVLKERVSAGLKEVEMNKKLSISGFKMHLGKNAKDCQILVPEKDVDQEWLAEIKEDHKKL